MEPDDISGLILWLKADAIPPVADETRVDAWPDSSLAGNDWITSRTSSVLGPTYQVAELNGLPVTRFTTGFFNEAGMEPDDPMDVVTPFSAFYVGKYNGASHAGRRSLSNIEPGGAWFMGPGDNWRWSDNGGVRFATGPSALDGAWVIHAVVQTAGEGTQYVYPLASLDPPEVDVLATPVNDLGLPGFGFGPHSGAFHGDLAELVVYDEEISEGDRNGLVAYFRDKWAGLVGPVNYDETGRLITIAATVTATDTLTLAPGPGSGGGGARMGGRAIRHHPRRRGSR